jgi:broad specificity phosphatase PhoE
VELVLIRHGQSEANRGGIHQGWSLTPLTQLGRQQAASAAEYLRNWLFDRVFCSDLLRAEETARIIFPPPVEISLQPLLREVDCGQISGMTSHEAQTHFGPRYKDCEANSDWRPFQGESVDMLHKRVQSFLMMLEESASCRRVAVVSHGGPIKALICLALDVSLSRARRVLSIDNASITILEWDPPRWVVQTVNSTGHLRPAETVPEIHLN